MVPVISANAQGPQLGIEPHARMRLVHMPANLPLVVLIHGYKYSPYHPDRNPHSCLLAHSDAPSVGRATSWPRRLAMRHGLIVGFGWDGVGTIWRAQANAAEAGRALAELVRAAGRPVDIVAHSLGARVALSAMAQLPGGAVSRAILISGAEFRSRADSVLETSGGASAEIINVCSRENDVFDALYESFVAPHRPFDRAIGAGLGRPADNWLDLQLDAQPVRDGLGKLGFRIPPPDRRICHWSGYLRTGTWVLYRALIEDRLPLSSLRKVIPGGVDPRWSRLFDGFTLRRGLPQPPSAPS
jgi:pimeloyl-ACP methyl ester carboxylesterase